MNKPKIKVELTPTELQVLCFALDGVSFVDSVTSSNARSAAQKLLRASDGYNPDMTRRIVETHAGVAALAGRDTEAA